MATSVSAVESLLAVNVTGDCEQCPAAMDQVIAQRGQLAVISSVFAFRQRNGHHSHAMSKAAVEQLGRGLPWNSRATASPPRSPHFSMVDTAMITGGLDGRSACRPTARDNATGDVEAYSAPGCRDRHRRRPRRRSPTVAPPSDGSRCRCCARPGQPDAGFPDGHATGRPRPPCISHYEARSATPLEQPNRKAPDDDPDTHPPTKIPTSAAWKYAYRELSSEGLWRGGVPPSPIAFLDDNPRVIRWNRGTPP